VIVSRPLRAGGSFRQRLCSRETLQHFVPQGFAWLRADAAEMTLLALRCHRTCIAQ